MRHNTADLALFGLKPSAPSAHRAYKSPAGPERNIPVQKHSPWAAFRNVRRRGGGFGAAISSAWGAAGRPSKGQLDKLRSRGAKLHPGAGHVDDWVAKGAGRLGMLNRAGMIGVGAAAVMGTTTLGGGIIPTVGALGAGMGVSAWIGSSNVRGAGAVGTILGAGAALGANALLGGRAQGLFSSSNQPQYGPSPMGRGAGRMY